MVSFESELTAPSIVFVWKYGIIENMTKTLKKIWKCETILWIFIFNLNFLHETHIVANFLAHFMLFYEYSLLTSNSWHWHLFYNDICRSFSQTDRPLPEKKNAANYSIAATKIMNTTDFVPYSFCDRRFHKYMLEMHTERNHVTVQKAFLFKISVRES